MRFSLFLGSFLAVAAVLSVIILLIRRRIHRFSRDVFGTSNLLDVLSDLDSEQELTPRSLNGCDRLLLPQIIKDFPDFDVSLAKTYVRDYLKSTFVANDGFTVHNVVIARYLPSEAHKTIIFQAAVSWLEHTKRIQKRYDLNYTYLLAQPGSSVAANCPNCGGALGYGVTVCPYCDSRVANILGNTWEFTEITET